jgi:uncharacterized protein YndB with AHSA1/START domain/DNA-binding transcriptional ArsR family regulator
MSSEAGDMDRVFKALADPTRRLLLDRLREQNGQTLTELCQHLGMARQSATQHLDVLGDANLISVVRRGRERLHYLNPGPIHEIEERWISGFEKPRLRTLSAIKAQAEEYAMDTTTTQTTIPTYVYVTYIKASAEQVWKALTDADITARYWDHRNCSDWQPGSTWEMRRNDTNDLDVVGSVLDVDYPSRLVITFETPGEVLPAGPSRVTYLLEEDRDIVKLTVTHENIPNVDFLNGISGGWPAVLANLKSYLETGSALPTAPWDLARAH